MKQHLIEALKATIAIVIIIAVIIGIIQLYSILKDDDTQELYALVRDAESFHSEIEGSALLDDFNTLLERVISETPEDSPEIETLTMNRILSARGYSGQFGYLYPVTGSVDILSSLKREAALLSSSYSKLYRAWLEKKSGNNAAYIEYYREAEQLFEQAMSLRDENSTNLNNLLSQLSIED